MAWGAGHEQEDDALGPGGVMRPPWRKWIRGRRRRDRVFAKQLAQSDRAQADAALLEEPPARDEPGIRAAIKIILTVHGKRPYSFVIVSSRLISTRDTTVQAAICGAVMPLGSSGGLPGLSAARSQGFSLPAAKRCDSLSRSVSNALDSRSVGVRARQRRNA